MKRKKLKWFVLPTFYAFAILGLFLGISLISSKVSSNKNYLFALNPLKNRTNSVVSTDGEVKIIAPIRENAAQIMYYFYDRNDEEGKQQKSLIYYENTYMQNTGIIYVNDETFEVIAVLDGIVKDVKDDNILGKVVEIEHSNELRTVYYCLNEVSFKSGDEIKQGEVIGISGISKIETGKQNNLLFEVYSKGSLINPEVFLASDISEFQQ